jgi:deazaflavin-dependent oxidoreductase (nitroreductase family)
VRPSGRCYQERPRPEAATIGGHADEETVMLFGKEHVERYRETDGEVGHEWKPGVYTLLLTTTGRKSGEPFTTPLIYGRAGDDYVVVASKGGDAAHPDWYFNLASEPEVEIQVGAAVTPARAHDASGDERTRLWEMMAEIWPEYDEYAEKAQRDIPVVVLTPDG